MAVRQLDRTVELRALTTLRIGGRPVLYERPRDYPSLSSALSRCRRRSLPFRVLGGGSNVLADDGELPFAVIHVCSPGFDWIRRTGPRTLRVGAGVRLGRVLAYCRRAGLGGLEFLAGIPGTVGGSVAGNAGAWGCCVAQRLVSAWTVDPDGVVRRLPADDIGFGYRSSGLSGRVVTEAEFALEPSTPERVERLIRHNLRQKASLQPVRAASAGCVFKNPPGESAGRLLDACGMKRRRVGGATVSEKHANFICNAHGARAGDVLELMRIMRGEVQRRFGISLEPELRLWAPRRLVA